MKTFYLTTPLYYVNARPHLGHTYTTVVADCLSRFKKMQGFDVCLLTGTDEQDKHERAALLKAFPNSWQTDHRRYQNLWARIGIEYDQFIRTSESRHYAGAASV
jgi:methionyl-tRNA synthetase